MVRKMYVFADHMDSMFTTSEYYESFRQISQMLHISCTISQDAPGMDDIIITGDKVAALRTLLLTALDQKINTWTPGEHPNVKINWNNSSIALDTRNEEHEIIYILHRLLQMTDAEIEKAGAIYFYSLAALDNTNSYIAKMLKSTNDGIELTAAFRRFTVAYGQYSTMQQEEFEERVNQLAVNGFIQIEEKDSGDKWIFPTVKTLAIKTI